VSGRNVIVLRYQDFPSTTWQRLEVSQWSIEDGWLRFRPKGESLDVAIPAHLLMRVEAEMETDTIGNRGGERAL
jgi:hypothetical protein